MTDSPKRSHPYLSSTEAENIDYIFLNSIQHRNDDFSSIVPDKTLRKKRKNIFDQQKGSRSRAKLQNNKKMNEQRQLFDKLHTRQENQDGVYRDIQISAKDRKKLKIFKLNSDLKNMQKIHPNQILQQDNSRTINPANQRPSSIIFQQMASSNKLLMNKIQTILPSNQYQTAIDYRPNDFSQPKYNYHGASYLQMKQKVQTMSPENKNYSSTKRLQYQKSLQLIRKESGEQLTQYIPIQSAHQFPQQRDKSTIFQNQYNPASFKPFSSQYYKQGPCFHLKTDPYEYQNPLAEKSIYQFGSKPRFSYQFPKQNRNHGQSTIPLRNPAQLPLTKRFAEFPSTSQHMNPITNKLKHLKTYQPFCTPLEQKKSHLKQSLTIIKKNAAIPGFQLSESSQNIKFAQPLNEKIKAYSSKIPDQQQQYNVQMMNSYRYFDTEQAKTPLKKKLSFKNLKIETLEDNNLNYQDNHNIFNDFEQRVTDHQASIQRFMKLKGTKKDEIKTTQIHLNVKQEIILSQCIVQKEQNNIQRCNDQESHKQESKKIFQVFDSQSSRKMKVFHSFFQNPSQIKILMFALVGLLLIIQLLN